MIAAINTNDRISARMSPARHIFPLRIYPPTRRTSHRRPPVPDS